MTEPEAPVSATLRDKAIESLKRKREFQAHLLAYVLVNAGLVTIWAVTGRGFFWPVFPMLGWGIGLAFHAVEAYGGGGSFSEDRIRREMERLSSREYGA